MLGYPMPDFKWSRFDDHVAKTGGIELVSNTPVTEIYGWVGDTCNDFRRDFRLIGLVDNDIGYSEMLRDIPTRLLLELTLQNIESKMSNQ